MTKRMQMFGGKNQIVVNKKVENPISVKMVCEDGWVRQEAAQSYPDVNRNKEVKEMAVIDTENLL